MSINPKVIDIYRLDSVAAHGLKAARDAGIRGVIHKASEGDAQPARKQPAYRERRQMAADEGLLWGAYHFLRPGRIIDQAHRFVDIAAPGHDTLLALDHEDARVPLWDAVAFLQEVARETGAARENLFRVPHQGAARQGRARPGRDAETQPAVACAIRVRAEMAGGGVDRAWTDAGNAASALAIAPLPFSMTSLCARVPAIGMASAAAATPVQPAPDALGPAAASPAAPAK